MDVSRTHSAAGEGSSLPEANPLRARRLAEIREMIDGGTYETTERLEAALSRFLAVVGEDH